MAAPTSNQSTPTNDDTSTDKSAEMTQMNGGSIYGDDKMQAVDEVVLLTPSAVQSPSKVHKIAASESSEPIIASPLHISSTTTATNGEVHHGTVAAHTALLEQIGRPNTYEEEQALNRQRAQSSRAASNSTSTAADTVTAQQKQDSSSQISSRQL